VLVLIPERGVPNQQNVQDDPWEEDQENLKPPVGRSDKGRSSDGQKLGGGLRGQIGFHIDSPQAHRSTGFPYGSFLSTSGERYPGVPANPAPQTHRQADTHTEVGT
jgi:hypothetical protein